jgi:hypothetical protein
MANKIAISFVIKVFFMLILSNKLIQMKPDGSNGTLGCGSGQISQNQAKFSER